MDAPISSAHSVRVGAIASELAASSGWSEALQHRLRLAGEYHDCAPELMYGSAFTRMTADLGASVPLARPQFLDADTFAIIRALSDPRCLHDGVRDAVELLRMADAIDEEFEFEPYADAERREWSPYAAAGLAKLRCGTRNELRAIVPRLPVFPSSAMHAIASLTRTDADYDTLEAIAGRDPVLAGTIVSAANSAAYAGCIEIRSLPRAISHIGCDAAKSVLLAAVLRPLFATPVLRSHWTHALESADAARVLAARSGKVQVDEAVLAALVHDIGVLALALANPQARMRCERLTNAGCPRRGAEWLTCGFDHAEASALVLQSWRFPATVNDAVLNHHTPERTDNTLAALLYLVEFWTCSEEDLPSTARLNAATVSLGLSAQEICTMQADAKLSSVVVL